MANLGNAWHLPNNAEPRGVGGMRSPIGPIVQGTAVSIYTGNQFQGAGTPGDQLQDGSAIFFKRAQDTAWKTLPSKFFRELGNNKYYKSPIPPGEAEAGDTVQYYLRIAYANRDTTFLHQGNGQQGTTEVEATAQGAPFSYRVEDHARHGEWSPVFALPNVAVHASVLPDGRVLMWGRRDGAAGTLDPHTCTPFVLTPASGTWVPTNPASLAVNLFCSGHAFLADGRLLVVGGHLADSDGISQASLFDWRSDTFTASAPMTTPAGQEVRRWYPTATTLPDGKVLVTSGSYIDIVNGEKVPTNVGLLQVWDSGSWTTIDQANGAPLSLDSAPLYPRMHVLSDGSVFVSGPNGESRVLQVTLSGSSTPGPTRAQALRDYCPALMYDTDKIMFIGGGNDFGTALPSKVVEVIDFAVLPPQWQPTGALNTPRRQHNATVLPDGSVLVTGGTRGGGDATPEGNGGFNDLRPGQPVHGAERWDPGTKVWTQLAAEEVDRCYHATAVLLPDATVLSAGGGEYKPQGEIPNAAQDSHLDAQIFSPPYLFRGPRPTITSASPLQYGQGFQISSPDSAQIDKVRLISLGSVTHSFDENQRVVTLPFTLDTGVLQVAAPASPNVCPPGYYMLFIVTQTGVPSQATMVQLQPSVAPALNAQPLPLASERGAAARGAAAPGATVRPEQYLRAHELEREIERSAHGTKVLIGVTGKCPYGIGACWGGAYDGLGRLQAVAAVAPIPNAAESTAEVFLSDDRLPPLEAWREEFKSYVNGSYLLRGVEVTLSALVTLRAGQLFLAATRDRRELPLARIEQSQIVQLDPVTRAPKSLERDEASAHSRLVSALQASSEPRSATVTGPVVFTLREPVLHVRHYALAPPGEGS